MSPAADPLVDEPTADPLNDAHPEGSDGLDQIAR